MVAPYVGAWIETSEYLSIDGDNKSHPTWVRGLKLGYKAVNPMSKRRTLRGCVD